MMNEVIQTLLNHRSIRSFTEEALSEEQIRLIVQSAQQASTSSYMQAYSIIGVKKKETKEKLAELAGNQSYVAQNGHLFIFCADLYRHELASQMEGVDVKDSLQSTEKFMVALIDAALAAQNAAIAAESMGLGICYIGGIRNNSEKVSGVLKLPNLVIPLFGLVVGYPSKQSSQKPRLPLEHIYHEEHYEQNTDSYIEELETYNEIIQTYYKERTNGVRSETWTQQMTTMLAQPKRLYMKEFVQKRGFTLK